jgi:AcrR family transcriptional regulator
MPFATHSVRARMLTDMAKLRRDEWIQGGFDALADHGIDALNVEPLAARLHVTKGSFYHHFADRRTFLEALLETWEDRNTTSIIYDVDRSATDPQQQLRALFIRTTTPNPTSDAIENAIRSWATKDQLAQEVVSRVDERRVNYVAGLLRTSGLSRAIAQRRARMFYRMLIGEFIWRASGAAPITTKEVDEMLSLVVTE